MSKIKVLLVDDEQELVTYLSKRLVARGFSVVGATSGEQALEAAAAQAFDVAVVDLKMPGIDGIEALRRLKEDLKDMDGQRLFPDRHAVTVPFTLNADEFALYKSVTAYINEYIPQQQGQRRTSAALAASFT